MRSHLAEWQEAEPLSHAPSLQGGEASFWRGKAALSWGTPGCPSGLGVGFQEHSITCPGQSPGEGAVHPSLPVSSPLYWLPTKNLLTFLKASEYTVHLCGVGRRGRTIGS